MRPTSGTSARSTGCASSAATSSATRTPRVPSRASRGTSARTSRPSTMTPTVTKSQAHQAGLAASKANNETATPGELVVFQSATGPKLAYEVITEGIKADQTPTRLHTIVDATTGKILTSWDDVKHGTGNGIFVGSVTLGTTRRHELHDEGLARATTRPTSTRPRAATARRSPTPTTSGATACRATASRPPSTRTTAPARRTTTTTPSSAAPASGTTAPAPAAASTTARTTSTPSGTARR